MLQRIIINFSTVKLYLKLSVSVNRLTENQVLSKKLDKLGGDLNYNASIVDFC